MNHDDDSAGGGGGGESASPIGDVAIPRGCAALPEFRAVAVGAGLGYFRGERFVIFGYCPGGGEVIWKDGKSSGFGTGGWRTFLEEIAPVVRRYGISVGDVDHAGSHVLLLDRARNVVYAAPRESAEVFLAKVNGVPRPARPCLCAPLDCRSCPARDCPRAGSAGPFDGCHGQVNPALISGGRFHRVSILQKRRG